MTPNIFSTESNGDKPKIHSDPFNANCFKEAIIHIHKPYFPTFEGSDLIYNGTIEFKNGDTGGSQNFKAINMNDLLSKMDAFMKSLTPTT